ncbi:MAG TPA: autotransporter domain-containing protein [Sphingomicrobium sp.]|nr:autotransporter domain-containing protein [Sphingomicrobium sp.]
MRSLLASTALGALAVVLATPASGEQVISTAVTTPLTTAGAGDNIRISSTGSVKPTGGAAVTINSNNSVKNEGTIAIQGANGSTGILANANLIGDINNTNIITIDEDYTPTDTDKDGDVDGPFAQGNNRFGIHVLGGGTYSGNILNSGTITVEGNQSAGIAVDSALTGSFSNSKTVQIAGDDSAAIRLGSVSGSVTIGSGSTTSALGHNSVGLLLGGDIGGALVIQGTVAVTGYRSTTAPADTSKLDADDLLQGGSAVVVGGNVAGGILLDTRPADNSSSDTDEDDDGIADASETTATVNSFGAAPAITIGSSTQDISVGAVASSADGHGLVIKGNVSGKGVYSGVSGTGLNIGGVGHTVSIAGGMTVTGSITATASSANAQAVHIGAGASVPAIIVSGAVTAQGGGTASTFGQAIAIDAGATVNSITNSGSIIATRVGTTGTAAAIIDHSGSLALVQNSGSISVTDASTLGDSATAIDLSARNSGATVRQVAAASGKPAPTINGNILFGTGADTLDLQAGTIFGKVDFGGGADALSLSGSSTFRGTLANSAGLGVTIGTGSTLDVKNLGTVDLASLTTASGANLGVTIGDSGHTLYNVAGTANFGTGTKILVTLDHVGTAAGTYTIIDAGTLIGGANLTDSIVTLPFLFNSSLTTNNATGQVNLNVQLKGAGELGLNASETAILDAALDATDADSAMSSVFLAAQDSATIRSTLQQLLPDHAGGAFEAATKGTRVATGILADKRPLSGLWLQQIAWGSSKSIGNTSSYDLTGWGATAGFDHALGSFASVGVTAAYLYGKDGRSGDELTSNHYEGGVYVRGGNGPFRLWARATAGTISFDSTRNFTGSITGGTVTRTSKGKWNGRVFSGSAGMAYEARIGRLSLRPNASVEYYKLTEKGYAESGGGAGFDLTVRKRDSDETAANGILTVGYDLLSLEPDASWARVELEGGWRQILSGKLGNTVASFGDGNPFTLSAEKRTSGWRGGLRVLAGGSAMTFAVEANAEEQQGKASLGGRLGVGLNF